MAPIAAMLIQMAVSRSREYQAEAHETGFILQRSTAFDYYYSFDTLDELTDYIEDNYEQGMASDALLQRAAILMRQAPTPPKLVVVQKVALTSLRRS